MGQPGQEYFQRLINLFAETGRETLLELLLTKIPNRDVKSFLSENRDKLDNLLGKDHISHSQYNTLLSETPDASKFDISTLVILLCYVCPGVSKPVAGWDTIPPVPGDESLGAHILHLKQARNELLAHRDNTDVKSLFYKGLKVQVKDVLKDIARYIGEDAVKDVKKSFKELESVPVDVGSDKQLYNVHMVLTWYKKDVERTGHRLELLQWSSKKHASKDTSRNLNVSDAVRRDEPGSGVSDDTKLDLRSLEEAMAHIELETNSRGYTETQGAGGHQSEPVLDVAQQMLQDCQARVDNIRAGLQKLLASLQMQAEGVADSQALQLQQSSVGDPSKNTGTPVAQSPTSSLQPEKAKAGGTSGMPAGSHLPQGRAHALAPVEGFHPGKVTTHAPPATQDASTVSVESIPDSELQQFSQSIGMNWELMAVELGYIAHQIAMLKKNYPHESSTQLYWMVKKWHDVVVSCGENPRLLLAAGFAALDNNEAAENVLGKHRFAGLRNRLTDFQPATKTMQEITRISFDLQAPFVSTSKVNIGAAGAMNFFSGSEVRLGSSLSVGGSTVGAQDSININIPGMPWSQVGETNIGGQGSVNVFASKFTTDPGTHVTIGSNGIQQQTTPKDVVRGEFGNSVDSALPKVPPSSTRHELKKEFNDNLSQSQVTAFGELMKSVCAVVYCGGSHGTAFRVGEKYLITAFHVIRDIQKEGISLSKHYQVTFNENLVYQPSTTVSYKLTDETLFDETLDIAFLTIANPDGNLPKALTLSTERIDGYLEYVSLIGYGNPDCEQAKHLDPGCPTILQNSRAVEAAHTWLQDHSLVIKELLQLHGKSPSLVDERFCGYDSDHNMIINCYSEQGASGGPLIDCRNPNSMAVVGVLTHGLPVCFWELPKEVQVYFPKNHRLEVGTRMSSIRDFLLKTRPDAAEHLFP